MKNEQKAVITRIYIIGALVFILTSWFSVGYNHFDEHFQIIEFAGLKLGLTEKANLPWEYDCQMRPAFQPFIVYSIYKTISLTGVTNPFIIAFFIRFFSVLLTFVSIHMIIRLYAPGITNRKLVIAFLLLSFFIWFVPYNSARFSSETISGRIFLIGLAWFFLRKKLKPADYLITGFLLGIAFITRYQVAFMLLGFAVWLAVIGKAGFRNLLMFVSGIMFATAAGIIIDRWFYGEWVLTTWNYFQQNILMDKASGFGISPWWYYIEQTMLNAFPPLSIICILTVFIYFIFYPKDILTWTLVPFLLVHFLIPHKEIRFLFPVIGFLPVMIIRSAETILRYKGYGLLELRITKITVKLFWYLNVFMVVVLIFRPADDQISLYKKLWNNYKTPATLYYTHDNPYHRAKVDAFFYKRSCLTLQHVDSLEMVVPSVDTVKLVVTNKPGQQFGERCDALLVYSSFPQWVRNFNVNNWIDRTYFWYIYELKPKQKY